MIQVLNNIFKSYEKNSSYVIGIDVGGTNTDAVIVELPQKRILSSTKTATTKDVSSGVFNSIQEVLSGQHEIKPAQINAVMLGTTAFVNAVL